MRAGAFYVKGLNGMAIGIIGREFRAFQGIPCGIGKENWRMIKTSPISIFGFYCMRKF